MKKINLLFVVVTMLLFSACNSTKVARQSENQLRGNWVLSEIVNDKAATVVITSLFNQAKLECFENSEWTFVENNNTGTYTLSGMGCPDGENNIKWLMEDDGDDTYFWFKQLWGNEKAKNVKAGYKMKLISLTEDQAHFMHEVPMSSEKVTLHFYFNKK